MPKLIVVPEPLEWLYTAAPEGNLNLKEVSRLLGCSVTAVRHRVLSGKFPHSDFKIGGISSRIQEKHYWKVQTVRDWFKTQKQ